MSTALHFYQNKQLELYASKAAQRLTLRQLVSPLVGVLLDSFTESNILDILWTFYE